MVAWEFYRVSVLILLLFSWHADGQEKRFRNALKLFPNFSDGRFFDRVNRAIINEKVLYIDTAIAVRYAFMQSVAAWDSYIVCAGDEKALNFWGERERLPKEVCQNVILSRGELFAYSLIRAVEREFPIDEYKDVLREEGYDPEDRSMNKSTAVGMGNVIGTRVADWMAADGWNSLGDLSRNDFPQQFEDYTGYTPVNPPWSLIYPLRWQPLTQADSKIGRFTTQTHVVPFLGQVKPLLLTEEEVEARQAPMPYKNMDAKELTGEDKETMDGLVKDLFDISANLTPEQRFLARWWDNKLLSIGGFAAHHFHHTIKNPYIFARWFLGEMLAQYDAMVVVWKEKRRIDAVRPETIIANFYKDEEVTAYVPQEGKAKKVKAGDWEPIIPTQPHSEYPSASACLCTAFADHADLMMKEHMQEKNLDKEPPTFLNMTALTERFGTEMTEGLEEVRIETMKEAGRSCGESRLWAGVHFGPSVPAGENLAEGLGQRGYEFVKKLANGEVPENCWWCDRYKK